MDKSWNKIPINLFFIHFILESLQALIIYKLAAWLKPIICQIIVYFFVCLEFFSFLMRFYWFLQYKVDIINCITKERSCCLG